MLGRLLFTGDAKAYEAIYQRHWRSLFSVACWKTNSQIAAEELVQEIFVRVWENRQKTLIENPQAYLKAALKYSVIGFIKSKLINAQTELGGRRSTLRRPACRRWYRSGRIVDGS